MTRFGCAQRAERDVAQTRLPVNTLRTPKEIFSGLPPLHTNSEEDGRHAAGMLQAAKGDGRHSHKQKKGSDLYRNPVFSLVGHR